MGISDVNHHINAFFWRSGFFCNSPVSLLDSPRSGDSILLYMVYSVWKSPFRVSRLFKLRFQAKYRLISLNFSFCKKFGKSQYFQVKHSQIDIKINTCKHIRKYLTITRQISLFRQNLLKFNVFVNLAMFKVLF